MIDMNDELIPSPVKGYSYARLDEFSIAKGDDPCDKCQINDICYSSMRYKSQRIIDVILVCCDLSDYYVVIDTPELDTPTE